ncbi:MAG: glycosyltransferase family 2 protein [Chthoniobacterales bacterium]
MQEIRLSVALVTRNRPESLARTLASLRAQAVQPWEVVISDDSDDQQAAAVRRIAETNDCQYQVGPRRGLYANRNQVALACRGTHLRTMDDDHEFPPDHVRTCLAAIENDARAVWIIGEFLPNQVRETPPECPGQLQPRGFSMAPPDPDNCWAISDGAAIYPREIFDRGLRFTEAFRFGAPYLEFGSRLHFLGYRIRQLRSTYVIHHYEASKRSLSDPQGEMAAEIFAMLCHSFVYQPTITNKILSLGQIALVMARSPAMAASALRMAIREYQAQRRDISVQSKATEIR